MVGEVGTELMEAMKAVGLLRAKVCLNLSINLATSNRLCFKYNYLSKSASL